MFIVAKKVGFKNEFTINNFVKFIIAYMFV